MHAVVDPAKRWRQKAIDTPLGQRAKHLYRSRFPVVVEDPEPKVHMSERFPDRFGVEESFNGNPIDVVYLRSEADYDWVEQQIELDDYYENPHAWGRDVDLDKRALAWMVSQFAPSNALDIGCNNGPLVSALADLSIEASGIDISGYAIDRALPGTNLIHGDFMTHNFGTRFDAVLALDLMEHLHPYRLDAYLGRIRDLLSDNGVAIFNIPVWGPDPVWGEVFPLAPCTYQDPLPSWVPEFERNELFSAVPVDQNGLPELGHLVWAGTGWWLDQFHNAGLGRLPSVEAQLHQRVDWFYNIQSIARRSFYVLARDDSSFDTEACVERITTPRPASPFFEIIPSAR
jgi:SAM-dependent methyltransferase